jgi:Fibronectin type III domain
MTQYKLDFRNKKHLEQLAMFEKLITSLDALPADKREDAYLEELRAADAAARASHMKILSLRSELKSEISHRKTLFDAARKSASRAGLGALLKTKYQPAEILATGLDLAAPKTVRLGPPDAPTNLRGTPTDNEGEAQLRWKRTIRRCWFDVQWHADPPDADRWHQEVTCFKQKCLVKGLVSGAKYWFRIRASNAHGPGPWSQLASVRVK